MMASFMSYFGGRRDPKQSARDAIVTLREQLHMIEKKEDYLQKKIDEELKRAKTNATSNKTGKCCIPRHKPYTPYTCPSPCTLYYGRIVLYGNHLYTKVLTELPHNSCDSGIATEEDARDRAG